MKRKEVTLQGSLLAFPHPLLSFFWEYPEGLGAEEIFKGEGVPVLHHYNQVTLLALGDDAVMVFVHAPPPYRISYLHFFSSLTTG